MSSICWAESTGWLSRGWISKPAIIAPDLLREIPLTPRFGFREAHGEDPPRIRLVDDYKISGINATRDLLETSVPESLTTTHLLARTHALL